MKMTIVPSEEPMILGGGGGGLRSSEVEKTGTVGRGRVISGPISPGCFSFFLGGQPPQVPCSDQCVSRKMGIIYPFGDPC